MTERWPWVVAFTFGLLHGFGFAGALHEVGLPENAIPLALLLFNVGLARPIPRRPSRWPTRLLDAAVRSRPTIGRDPKAEGQGVALSDAPRMQPLPALWVNDSSVPLTLPRFRTILPEQPNSPIYKGIVSHGQRPEPTGTASRPHPAPYNRQGS